MKVLVKRKRNILIAGVVLAGLLTGCGSQSSATTSSNTQAATDGSNQSQSGQHKGQFRNGQGMLKALENAGASETDAQSLAKLIQQTHTQPKWVMDQLKNKVSVADITKDINDGKAPKFQRNGNGQHQNSDNQSNSTTQSGSNSN